MKTQQFIKTKSITFTKKELNNFCHGYVLLLNGSKEGYTFIHYMI